MNNNFPLSRLKTILLIVFTAMLTQIGVAQAPAISYASPQVYAVNTTIAPLTPANAGGAVLSGVQVTTFGGNGVTGSTNGQGNVASFYNASAMAIDGAGNVFVADYINHIIRKITPTGLVSTFAGSGVAGSNDGNGVAASFNYPGGIALDASGNVFVADCLNNKIRKITPAGVVTTLAGNGSQGATDGVSAVANFYNPTGVAVDAFGNVFVADCYNNKIRKISPTGNVTTIAGTGLPGAVDANGTTASFNYPTSLVIDGAGVIYVADFLNHKIRKISASGLVATFAGSGAAGSVNGTGSAASFNKPKGIAIDNIGTIYVADGDNLKIRKINPSGVVSDLAGMGAVGAIDGAAASASFNYPTGLATDVSKNVYVADFYNSKIRKITQGGYTISPNLPAGLSFDSTTGVISGTPTVATPATNYTITAYNASGSSSTIVNIAIIIPLAMPLANVSTQPTCTTSTGVIVVTAPIGSNYKYSIDGSTYQSATTFANLIPNSYNVSVKDLTTGYVSVPNIVVVNAASTIASPTASATVQPTCATLTGTIVVSAPIGANYEYSINGTTYQANTNFTGVVPNTYSVTAKDLTTGCVSNAISLTVNSFPTIANPTASVSIQPSCTIPKGTIIVTAPTGTNLEYSVDGVNYQANATFTGLVSNSYSVTVRNTANGCVSNAVPLTVNTVSYINAPIVTTPIVNCQNSIAMPLAVTPLAGATINWYSSQTGVTPLASAPTPTTATTGTTIYYVSQSNPTCESLRTAIIVNVIPAKTPNFYTIQPFCAGSRAPILPIVSINGISGTWLPPIIYNTTSGNYVFSPNTNECAVSKSIAVVVNQKTLLNVDYTVTDAFEDNQVITVLATNAGDYLYQLDNENQQASAVFENVPSGLHTITVYDQNGCSLPIKKPDVLIVNYPKFFTPNGDGINDIWTISGLKNQSTTTIIIYDRYGKLLKEINNRIGSWDGKLNGQVLPADDYWFTVDYFEKGVSKTFKSHFSLKR